MARNGDHRRLFDDRSGRQGRSDWSGGASLRCGPRPHHTTEPSHLGGEASRASVFVIKTRGTVSCTPEAQKPILAKAGHKLEAKFASPAEEARAFMDLIRSRDYDTRLTTKSLISLRQQHLTDADLTPVTRNVRANLDFDFKRQIVNSRDVDGLLTADTAPWQTIEEFEEARDGLEAWKKSTRSVLKTVADYQAMSRVGEGAGARRAAGTKTDNTLGPLTSAFLKIAALGELGMARIPDAELAAHMTKLSGVAVSTTKVWKPRAFSPGACSVRLQAGRARPAPIGGRSRP